jgi:hypothetical protein
MGLRLRLLDGLSRVFRSRLFRCIADGLRRHPWRTLRHIWIVNPFVRATWQIFSLRINGETFLRDFTEACGEANIAPFLMWGTLLGCVREGGLLKHDRDIDVGILARDWPKRSLLIDAMHRRGYGVKEYYNYQIKFIGRDLLGRLDVDVFFPWKGKMICCLDYGSGKWGSWFPLHAFNNFRRLTFLGTRVSIPDPPERVLETAYGDWRTPIKKFDWQNNPNRLHIAEGETLPKLPEEPSRRKRGRRVKKKR